MWFVTSVTVPSRDDLRIIPALAGNTVTHWGAAPPPSDHPRAGGEHDFLLDGLDESSGTSPRWRGTLAFVAGGPAGPRIIPALAGNTVVKLATYGHFSRIIPALAGNT